MSLKKRGKKRTPRDSRVREYTGILTDFFVLSGKGKAEAVLTFIKEQIHGERRVFYARQEAILLNI